MKSMRHCDVKEAIRLRKLLCCTPFKQALSEFERVRSRVGEKRYDRIVMLISSAW